MPEFSAVRARRHVDVLTRIGPRIPGTRGSRRARSYLVDQLQRLGAEVHEWPIDVKSPHNGEPVALVHLTGVLGGDSDDLIVLAAHYDTPAIDGVRFVGANDGASGPALLLELGRVLALESRPYTIWLTFIDGDAVSADPGVPEPAYLGSRALAAELASDQRLADIRLAVFFNQVCDSELTIARDLRSHVVHRETFWDSAAQLGAGDAFARGQGFESPPGPHLSFIEHDMRRVVAIVDDRLGSDLPPGALWRTERDSLENCDAASLETVGQVSHAALGRISQRLAKIDRFAAPAEEDPSLAADPAQAPSEAVSPPAHRSP